MNYCGIQCDPVNMVTSGPKKVGCKNRVAILPKAGLNFMT